MTIGLPEETAQFLEDHIPRGFHIGRIDNASVLRQMGRGFRTYLLMSAGYSCSLFSEPPTETGEVGHAAGDSEQKRRRHKYEKMGWSAAKIERAMAQRPKGRPQIEPFVGLRGDVQRFLGELAANVGQLAVVVHWYGGDLQEGRFACKQGETVPPEVALKEGLRLATDEIVRVKLRG